MDNTECQICGGTEFETDLVRGEIICTSCGMVQSEQMLASGAEWRAFTLKERGTLPRASPVSDARIRNPIGGMILRSDVFRVTDNTGNDDRFSLLRMAKYDLRSRHDDSIQRSAAYADRYMDKLKSDLKLSSVVIKEAVGVYKRAYGKKLVRGRAIKDVVAASVYSACRVHGLTHSMDEVAKSIGCTRKNVARTYRMILRKLTIKVPVPRAAPYIAQIVSKMELPGIVERDSLEMLDAITKGKIVIGKDPRSIAMAVVYLIIRGTVNTRTQKEIALVLGMTEVTLRNRYKDIKRFLANVQS